MPRLAEYAENFQQEFIYQNVSNLTGINVNNCDELINVLENPLNSAKVFFKLYAFARAGGQRANYDQICIELLNGGFSYPNGESFFNAFELKCEER